MTLRATRGCGRRCGPPLPWIRDPKVVQWLLELHPASHKIGAWARLVLRFEAIAREDKNSHDIVCLAAGSTRSYEAEPAYCRLCGGMPAIENHREWLGFDFDSTLGFPGEGPDTWPGQHGPRSVPVDLAIVRQRVVSLSVGRPVISTKARREDVLH